MDGVDWVDGTAESASAGRNACFAGPPSLKLPPSLFKLRQDRSAFVKCTTAGQDGGQAGMCSAQEEGKDEESSEWCHAYFLQVKISEFREIFPLML